MVLQINLINEFDEFVTKLIYNQMFAIQDIRNTKEKFDTRSIFGWVDPMGYLGILTVEI